MALFDFLPATRGDIKRLEKQQMITQQQVDDLTAKVGGFRAALAETNTNVTNIGTGVNKLEDSFLALKKEFEDFKAGNPGVDISGLETAISGVSDDVQALRTSTQKAADDLADGPEATPTGDVPDEPTPEGGNPNI